MAACLAGLVLLLAVAGSGCSSRSAIEAKVSDRPKTFCNPLNLDYRFMLIDGGEGIREAADPVVVSYKDHYLLFASKSSGYWISTDFVAWQHIIIPDGVLPIEDYAPAVMVHGGYVYYVGSTHGKAMLYRSDCPETGRWEKVKEIWSYWDPAFYTEGDRLYLYYGCSPIDPIYVKVLSLDTLEETEAAMPCFNSDKEVHGWERTGERHELPRRPYIEGAWMTAHDGRYYLQYAAPGTEWKSYADGVYVTDTPTGPFRYMDNSPVSAKPTGFTGGAGHGCLFQVGEQWWKAATNSISVRHMFERRLSFYPSGFDSDGVLYTDTYLGDYPQFLPGSEEAAAGRTPGWMLLSYRKPVSVSSSLPGYPAEHAVDEEARTAWVAEGNGKEWMQIDLEKAAEVCAVQVNYDEYGATQRGVGIGLYQSYRLLASHDGVGWTCVADCSDKRTDTPHDYVEFERPFEARYLRWENEAYTVSPHVSLRELRVFGKGGEALPAPVGGLQIERDTSDSCRAVLSWQDSAGAEGYVVRYGIAPDKLYASHQVLEGTQVALNSLNSGVNYFFTVDAYNARGVTRGTAIVRR